MSKAQELKPDDDDFDAWKCEHCDGRGWYWKAESIYHGPEIGTENAEFKHECEPCESIGWCGPDAEAAARASNGGKS